MKQSNERSGAPWDPLYDREGRINVKICPERFLFGKKALPFLTTAANYLPTIFPQNVTQRRRGNDKCGKPCANLNLVAGKRVTRLDANSFSELVDNDRPETTRHLLSVLWSDDTSKDLTLVCSLGRLVKCHSAVFSLFSPIAAELLMNQTEVVILPDFDVSVVEQFLKRSYCVTPIDNSQEVIDFDLATALGINASSPVKKMRMALKRHVDKTEPGTVTFVRKLSDLSNSSEPLAKKSKREQDQVWVNCCHCEKLMKTSVTARNQMLESMKLGGGKKIKIQYSCADCNRKRQVPLGSKTTCQDSKEIGLRECKHCDQPLGPKERKPTTA